MPYRMLCNGVHQEGAKPTTDPAFGLFWHVPLHNMRYGIGSGALVVCGIFNKKVIGYGILA